MSGWLWSDTTAAAAAAAPPATQVEPEHDTVEKCERVALSLQGACVEDERMIGRHLRASKGDELLAAESVSKTNAWRIEFEVEKIRSKSDPLIQAKVLTENSTGKMFVRGYDRCDRAILHVIPRCEVTFDHAPNLLHLVFNIEKAIECTRKKSTNQRDDIVLIIDYNGFSFMNTPQVKTTAATLKLLQCNYPERLFKAYLVNPPFVFRSFYGLISPFLEEKTKEKLNFVYHDEDYLKMLDVVDVGELPDFCRGGVESSEHDAEKYLSLPLDEGLPSN